MSVLKKHFRFLGQPRSFISLPKYIISCRSDRTIGSFSNDCTLNPVSVTFGNGLLHSSRHKNIAFFIHQIIFIAGISTGTGESVNGSVCIFPFFKSFDINTIWIDNSSIPFNDSCAFSTSSGQVTASMQTHITKTLNNEGFSTPSGGVSNHRHVGSLVDKVIEAMENTTSCGTCPSMNTTLMNGLASNTG